MEYRRGASFLSLRWNRCASEVCSVTGPEFLESRGWRRRGSGWLKRGWYLGALYAEILERWMESENGAVTPREEMDAAERRRFWGYLNEKTRKAPPFGKLETCDWKGIMALSADLSTVQQS